MQEPEIDDELAAMEANAPGARGITQKIIDTVLRKSTGKGLKTQGPTGGTKHGKARSQGRAIRRAMGRVGQSPDPHKSPHARLGRRKLTKSQPQLASEYRAAIRGELSRIKLTKLLTECPELKFVAGVPGLGNVWQLSQAPTARIHDIPGMGPARRKKIRAYLIGRNVPVVWEA